jgi:hypothetical protein
VFVKDFLSNIRLGERIQEFRVRLDEFNRDRRRRGLVFPIRLSTPSSRLFVLLLASLAGLVGAFALALTFLTPVSPGSQISLNQLISMSNNAQIVTATLYDFDHRVTGTYTLNPPPPPSASGSSTTPSQGTTPTNSTSPNPAASPGAPNATQAATPPATAVYWVSYPTSDAETPALIERLAAGGATVTVRHQLEKNIVQFISQ